MTIALSYAERNALDAGSCASVDINGAKLKVKAGHKRRTLAQLLAATPSEATRAEGWDDMQAIAAEH